MQISPFQKSGKFYRGNLHLHSTNSDGKLTPAEVVDAYRSRGYDFIALTDHFLPRALFKKPGDGCIPVSDTTDLRRDDFTTLLGAEIHGPGMSNGANWHLVAAGLPADFASWDGKETGAEIAKRAFEAGAFVGIAHPSCSMVTLEDAEQVLPYSHAVEIYNHAAWILGEPESWHFTDLLLHKGAHLGAYASDDAHFVTASSTISDAFGGWVMVKADSLDPDALLTALKAGDYYASTGADIHDIAIEGNEFIVRCSSARSVIVSGQNGLQYKFADGARVHDVAIHGDEVEISPSLRNSEPVKNEPTAADPYLTEVRFPLAPIQAMPYCRVTVVGSDGKLAWSNPIWSTQIAVN